MNSIQNQANISYISAGETNIVRTPEVNTSIVDPNIYVIKSCCEKSAQRGSEIRYTVSVINSGEIATTGNVLIKDYLDNAGSFIDGSAEIFRNNKQLTPAASLDTLTRETCWFEHTAGDNMPSVTITSLIPGDIVVCTYSVYIDEETPLINNELHNTASATYNLNSHTITQRSDICTVNVNYSYLLAAKRGRSQGHDGSNLFYALELTNDGTSEASQIVITENFPPSFQPKTSYAEVKKDIAIVNFLRHPNSIDSIITRSKAQKAIANSLYEELNANYYRLSAIQQHEVLATISSLSSLSLSEQQELIYNTAINLIPILNDSQALAIASYNRIFTPDTTLDPNYSCIFKSIETLYTAVESTNINASNSMLPDSKDTRASYICDAHDGAVILLDLCDLTNNAITLAAVVNRFITTNAAYLRSEFEVLEMDTMPGYLDTYNKLVTIVETAYTNLNICTTQKDIVAKKTVSSETLMTTTMNLAFSEEVKIKEADANYNITINSSINQMILTMNDIHIPPQTLVGTTTFNGHMDIYLNGHIDITKF